MREQIRDMILEDEDRYINDRVMALAINLVRTLGNDSAEVSHVDAPPGLTREMRDNIDG